MKALLAHDQKRLARDEAAQKARERGEVKMAEYKPLTKKDKDWIENRRELAEQLGDAGDAGERFFRDPINRHYRYYKMEPGDAANMSYSIDWLRAVAALREKDGVTEGEGAYIKRMQAKDGDKFTDSAYANSLIPVETVDGELRVDVARLVADARKITRFGS